MPEKRTCEECGADVPSNAPLGLCPRCLARTGMNFAPPFTRTGTAEATIATPVRPRVHCFGDYELLEEIARGGMGVVYRARQVTLNRVVAIKVLLFGQFASDEFIKRFRAEAEAAGSLQHPNIVTIHEIGEHDGQQYFSMDYIAGRNLAELVHERPLAPKEAAVYLKTISEAIHYAHQKGVLHRDLKPSNILIDAANEPHITDFGLAKKLAGDSDVTPTGQMLGSPNYMPPEQADSRRGPLEPASDVYSLGAILYQLLTGRPPFLSPTLEETLRQLASTEPVSLRLLNPAVPRDLETICLKCLEKDPRRRYQTAQSLANELGRFLHGEPILARPANRLEKLWRWSRRQPALATSVAALLVVFVSGFIGVWMQWRRAEKQREVAETKTEIARSLQYAGDMNLALRTFEDGNRAQALHLLEQHRPANGHDPRGFEWRHLWWLCRGDYEFALPRHPHVVGNITFSADGRFCATYSWNNTLQIWDVASREKPLLLVTNAASIGGFAPGNGRFIVGRRDGTIALTRWSDGEAVASLANAGELVAAALDGNTIVTIDAQSSLNAWDIMQQRLLFRVPGTVPRQLDYHGSSGVAISGDGNFLAVVEHRKSPLRADPGIQLWDVRGTNLLRALAMNRQIRCLQFSPRGDLLAVGDGNGTIWLWDTTTFQSRTIEAHDRPVVSLAFSPDGKTVASGSTDETMKLWDLAAGTQKPGVFRGHAGAVWSLAFTPDGKRLASGSRDTAVKFWNVTGEKPRSVVTNLYSKEWGNFTFSPNSKWIAAGCRDNTVRIWDVTTLREQYVLPRTTFAVAFSRDASLLLVAGSDEVPQWFDMETKARTPLPSYRGRMEGRVPCVDLSPDRGVAAIGFDDGNIQLLEIETGREVATFFAHKGGVGSLAFSPLGNTLVSGGRDKSVAVWDTRTQQKLRSRSEHRGSVCAVAVSANGKVLASGCNANTIKFWDAGDMHTSLASMSYHQAIIRTLCFSPDGKTLASGSEDNTVKLWSVSNHLELASYKFDDHVRLVAFAPNGNHLAIVTDNGTLHLLHAVSLEQADQETVVRAK